MGLNHNYIYNSRSKIENRCICRFEGGLGLLIWRMEYGTYQDSDDGEELQLSEVDRQKFKQLKIKILKNCAKLVRLYAQLQVGPSRVYFRSNDDGKSASTTT